MRPVYRGEIRDTPPPLMGTGRPLTAGACLAWGRTPDEESLAVYIGDFAAANGTCRVGRAAEGVEAAAGGGQAEVGAGRKGVHAGGGVLGPVAGAGVEGEEGGWRRPV